MAGPNWRDIPNNTNSKWYKDAGLRMNVFYCLSLCFVIATNVGLLLGNELTTGLCVILAVYCVELMSDGGAILGGLQANPAWNKYFGRPQGVRLGLYTAAYFLPSVVTSYFGDYISGKYGRRWAVIIGMSFMLAGALVNSFAANVAMWVGGRAIAGVGVGIVKVGAPVLIQEIAHPRLRPTLGSCYQAFAYIGQFLAGWMTFAGLFTSGDWSWRWPSVLQAPGPVFVILVAWYCPESPRWLYSKGRADEARIVLAKLHSNGDQDDPLVQFEMAEIARAKEKADLAVEPSYLDFLRTPGNRKRLIVLIALAFSLNWMGNGIISFYLAPVLRTVGVTAPVQITLINAGLATWNLIFAIFASIKVDKFGRRPLFLTSVAGMLTCYCIITGLSAGFASSKNKAMGTAVFVLARIGANDSIPFLYIYFGFYAIAFTPLPISYTVEIMPFAIRSKGMALFTSVATLGNSFNQFVNPVALKAIAWRYYLVYVGILMFYGVFIYLVFPETKGLSAEAAAVVFDGIPEAISQESIIDTRSDDIKEDVYPNAKV